MKRVGNSRGFTVVETIIFLAVSSGLFVSAMLMMSGQQARTEFHQAVGEIQSTIDDVTNNVATGYYKNTGNLKCSVSGSNPPTISATAVTQGTNQSCVFLGQVIQFKPETSPATQIRVFTLVGRRLAVSGASPATLPEALPVLVTTGNAYDTQTLPSDTRVYKAFYIDDSSGGKQEISGFAVTTTLANYSGSALSSGSTTANITPITDGIGATVSTYRTAVNSFLQSSIRPTNPASGVYVCMDSGGTDQHFIVRIGRGGSLSSQVDIRSSSSSTDAECNL